MNLANEMKQLSDLANEAQRIKDQERDDLDLPKILTEIKRLASLGYTMYRTDFYTEYKATKLLNLGFSAVRAHPDNLYYTISWRDS